MECGLGRCARVGGAHSMDSSAAPNATAAPLRARQRGAPSARRVATPSIDAARRATLDGAGVRGGGVH
eukprot:816288-Prymnesium_polylepis.1